MENLAYLIVGVIIGICIQKKQLADAAKITYETVRNAQRPKIKVFHKDDAMPDEQRNVLILEGKKKDITVLKKR